MQFSQEPETKVCEICGKRNLTGYMFSIAACWLVTGHAHVPAYMCDQAAGNQHFGCCPEHALEALRMCLQAHMHTNGLLERHKAAEAEGKARILESDKAVYERLSQ